MFRPKFDFTLNPVHDDIGPDPEGREIDSNAYSWYRAGRYIGEKVRFYSQYIPVSPGPKGIRLI
jgi:hypothetical protein